MTQLPNIITLLRIAGSMGLLFCDVMGVVFWIIYALCGISDIVDGWLARKLKCVTRTGALLDSLADICFVAGCVCKFLPILDSALPLSYSKELPQWLPRLLLYTRGISYERCACLEKSTSFNVTRHKSVLFIPNVWQSRQLCVILQRHIITK